MYIGQYDIFQIKTTNFRIFWKKCCANRQNCITGMPPMGRGAGMPPGMRPPMMRAPPPGGRGGAF